MQATHNAATTAHGETARPAADLIEQANKARAADVQRRLGVIVGKGGVFTCPSCEEHKPTATFRDDNGDYGRRWRCPCGAGGSLVDLVVMVNQSRGKALSDADAARVILGKPLAVADDGEQVTDAGEITTSQNDSGTVKEIGRARCNETRPEIVNMSDYSPDRAEGLRASGDALKSAIQQHVTPYLQWVGADDKPREIRLIKPGQGVKDCWIWTPDRNAEIVELLRRAHGSGWNAYVTINPIRGDMVDEVRRRWAERNPKNKEEKKTTIDTDIERRVFLPVDIDPKRPSGTLATPDQTETARSIAERIVTEWYRVNFPNHAEPLIGCSGSGYQILIPCDIPADEEGDEIIKGVLKLLSQTYDTEAAHVDTTVSNRSRIMRICGTKAFYSDGSRFGAFKPYEANEGDILTIEDLRPIVPKSERKAKPTTAAVKPINGKARGDMAKRLDAYIKPILDDIATAIDGEKHDVLYQRTAKIANYVAGAGLQAHEGEYKARIRAALEANPGHVASWEGAEKDIRDGWSRGIEPERAKTLEDRPMQSERNGHAGAVEVPEEFGGPRAEQTLADMGFTSASEIAVEPIEYLIPGVMARGELTLIVGAAGSGKTKVAMARAAMLTTGKGIDGKPVKGGSKRVAIISFEECPRRTIVPVCQYSGMDLNRAVIYEQPTGSPGVGTVAELCAMLEKLASDGVAYVVIDSLTALYSRLGYDVNDVKIPYAIHGEINRVARDKNICVELIHHYGKASGAAYDNHQRAAGSYAIFSSVRSMLQVEHDMATGTRFIGVSPNKNNLGLLTDCLAFRTKRVAEHLNDGQGYIIAELDGWNRDETIDDITTRIMKTKNDELRKKVKPVAVEVAEAITTFIDNAGGVAAVEDIDKHLAKAKYASNAIREGKRGFDKIQVRRIKKWFLTTKDEYAAKGIIDERFPEEKPDVKEVVPDDSESVGEKSLEDRA